MKHWLATVGACALLASTAVMADDSGTSTDKASTSTTQDKTTTPDNDAAKANSKSKADARDDESVTYSGGGLSYVRTNFDNVKAAVSLDGVVGFHVPNINWIAAELNIGLTVIPGKNKGGSSSTIGGSSGTCTSTNPNLPPGCTPATPSQTISSSSDDYQMQMISANIVMRSPGRFYAMGRLGYGYQISTDLNSNSSGGQTSFSGAVYSAGGGWRYGKGPGGVELVYSKLLDHVHAIGFNISYGFGGRHRHDYVD